MLGEFSASGDYVRLVIANDRKKRGLDENFILPKQMSFISAGKKKDDVVFTFRVPITDETKKQEEYAVFLFSDRSVSCQQMKMHDWWKIQSA